MRAKVLVLAVMVVLSLSLVSAQDSWTMFRGNPQRTGYTNLTGDLGAVTQAWKFQALNGIFSSPAVGDLDDDGDMEIVVGSEDGNIYALDDSGKTIWSYKTSKAIRSSPALADLNDDGKLDVVVGTTDGKILALDGSNGREIWKLEFYNIFRSSPVIYDIDSDYNQEIVIGSENGTLYTLDGESGLEEWVFSADGDMYSSPTVGDLDNDGDMEVIAASRGGVIYAFQHNGTLLWQYNTTNSIYSTPALADINNNGLAEVLVGADDGYFYSIEGGRMKWKLQINGSVRSSPAVADIDNDGVLDVVVGTAIQRELHGKIQLSENNALYALDGVHGSVKWRFDVGGMPISSSPAVADIDRDGESEVVFGPESGFLYALENGRVEWQFDGGTGLLSSPTLADVDSDGDLEILMGYLYSNNMVMLDSLPKPDLIVGSIWFSNDFPQGEDVLNVTISIYNEGDVGSDSFNVSVYRRSLLLDDPITNFSVPSLGSGRSFNYTFVWTVALPKGEQGIYAITDSVNVINESDETNNGLYRGFKSDLRIASLDVPELQSLEKKAEIEVTGTVENRGNIDLGGVGVGLILDSNGTENTIGSATVELIKARSTAPFSMKWGYEPSGVEQSLVVEVDPENQVDEMYEDNNRVSEEIVVKVEAAPPVPTTTKGGGEKQNPMVIILLLVVVFIVVWKKVISKRIKARKEKKGKVKEKKEEPETATETKEETPDAMKELEDYQSQMPDASINR
jgi:outer membrane protein assembly factor BamB